MCSTESKTYGSEKTRVVGNALFNGAKFTRVRFQRAEAREIDRVRFAAQLARVVHANSEPTFGPLGDALAHPAHGLHGRIAIDVHVGRSHQSFAAERCS